MHNKADERQEAHKKRSSFSGQYIKEVSGRILTQLQTLDTWQTRQVVHLYLPIQDRKEVDTWPALGWLLKTNHEVWGSYLPQNEGDDGFCRLSEKTQYSVGRYNTPLPEGEVVKTIQPTVVVVPCLAADKNGNRLGYGSGWYDQFLSLHPAAVRIGLVFSELLVERIDREQHDQSLDILITPEHVLRTGAR